MPDTIDRTPSGPHEDQAYLTTQLITYLGNKRALLGFIGDALAQVKQRLGRQTLALADVFSGSGVVSRFFKAHALRLYANDLEPYCHTINRCYLSNAGERDERVLRDLYAQLTARLAGPLEPGIIAELYAPRDDAHILPGERVFYTPRNARYIDTARRAIGELPEEIRHFFIAPLLAEASVKNNTAGVFKGFYRNSKSKIGQYGGDGRHALARICADIALPFPVFSAFDCQTHLSCGDANAVVRTLPRVDLMYIDPPYNQHPYGSNYFMLNLINSYERPAQISRVSGIPADWTRSAYNKNAHAQAALTDLCAHANTRFLLISFNSDGFIEREDMRRALSDIGRVEIMEQRYNTYRASRNLRERAVHTNEYLFLVDKG